MMKNTLVWTIIIFICAAVFRLTFLDLIEFKLDEARDVYEMGRFYSEPYFIQRGTIQSTGVYNPPLWYYFLVVLSLPSRDPQYLSFMIALINCLAVVGFYLVVRKFYGQFVGVTAGLLMAFSPWMIVFGKKIWAPDLILPLVVPIFYFLHKIFFDKTYTAVGKMNYFWLTFLLSLLAQLHASGWFLAVASIIVIMVIKVIQKIRVNFKFAFLGLCLSLIPLTPYLIYQFQNGCPDCQLLLIYQQGEALGAVPAFDANAFLRPFQFINGSGFQNTLGEEGYRQFLDQYPIIGLFNYIFLLEFGLFILGVIFLASPGRSQGPPSRWILLVILVTVPLLVFVTRTPAHLYYFLIISPVSILVYALGIASLRRINLWIPTFVGMTVVIINIIFTFSFYGFLSKTEVISGDYGAVYSVTWKEAQEKNMRVEEYVISLYNNFTE